MNFVQKNRAIVNIGIVGVLVIAGMVLLLLPSKKYTVQDIIATVQPTSVKVGQQIFFEDRSPFTKNIKWIFGDGHIEEKRKGQYAFSKPGYYQVSLIINKDLVKTFSVMVNDNHQPVETETTSIEAPANALQFEEVTFQAESPTAKVFDWDFGDGQGSSSGQVVKHTFIKPGKYIVRLITDHGTVAANHAIQVIQEFEDSDVTLKTKMKNSEDNDDFKKHLQNIANGKSFNENFNYLRHKYLCGSQNIPVSINGQGEKLFYNYCMGLQFDKNNFIQEVNLAFDADQKCVNHLEVKQSKM